MMDEEDYFKDKKDGWRRLKLGGELSIRLKELKDKVDKAIELESKNSLETLERIKHVLEKRNSKNTNT